MSAPPERTWVARWATEIEFAATTADEALAFAKAASEHTTAGAQVTDVYGVHIAERPAGLPVEDGDNRDA